MKGLIIKQPWIDKILSGEKTWEIRGSNTNVRGIVKIIKSGSGKIYGEAELLDSLPLSENDYNTNREKHMVQMDYGMLWYSKPHAWILGNVKMYDEPIPYNHPQGAVIWVNLKELES